MNFESLIGKKVLAMVPIFDQKILSELLIHGVESGGLWVESTKTTQAWAEQLGLPALQTPLFFLPYHEIRFAFAPGGLALSEKAFGVQR